MTETYNQQINMSEVLAFLDTLTDEQLETLTDDEIIRMMREQDEQ